MQKVGRKHLKKLLLDRIQNEPRPEGLSHAVTIPFERPLYAASDIQGDTTHSAGDQSSQNDETDEVKTSQVDTAKRSVTETVKVRSSAIVHSLQLVPIWCLGLSKLCSSICHGIDNQRTLDGIHEDCTWISG